MRTPSRRRVCSFVPLATMFVLVLAALPRIALPSNPQHMDQARAFLQGSVWIDAPTTTHDMGEISGRWYSPFPPLPALLAAAALLTGANADLVYNLAILATALLAIGVAARLGQRHGGPVAAAWAAVALGLGSGLSIATILHDTYHSAHVLAVACVLGAVHLAARRRPRWLLVGFLLGLGALARQPVVLVAPALLALGERPVLRWRPAVRLAVGVAVPFSLYLALNLLRFGTPFESGYGLIHHHARMLTDLAAHGVFSPAYLIRNLAVGLAGMPRVVAAFPYLVPDPNGVALWLVSPWLALAVLAFLRPDRPGARRVAAACLLGSALVSIPHLFYVNTGWVQFGYRFALDQTPLLLLAAILAVRRERRSVAVAAVSWSVFAHAWGFVALLTWAAWSPLLER